MGKQSIYIIYNREFNRTKIGISNNPERRCAALQSAVGCFLYLKYYTKPIENANDIEKLMHKLFNDKRAFGEWFVCDPKAPIKRLKALIQDGGQCRIINYYEKGKSIYDISYLMGVSQEGIESYLKTRLKIRDV